MKIAVTDTGREDKQKLYLNWLRSFDPNAELVVLSYQKKNSTILSGFDGLLLTGGIDIDPKFSKAVPIMKVGKTDPLRDEFEFGLLDDAVKKGIPVLGVCRGLQIANVFFGGTLSADLQFDGYSEHTAKDQEPVIEHAVHVRKDSFLHEVVGSETGVVNSYHHQGVKTIGDSLQSVAVAEDGVIESLEWKEKNGKPYFLAVQWHPERMNDIKNPMTSTIGISFLDAVKKYCNSKK